VTREHGYREYDRRAGTMECGRPMMGSDGWPLDAESAVELVARVVEEVDERTEEGHTILLADFLCAAWPSRWAQDQ
jgi:hypothetical protein